MQNNNGTNFVGAANELREIQDSLQLATPNLQENLAQRGIQFIFNPSEAPWMGGLWEAAVKTYFNFFVGEIPMTAKSPDGT